MNKAMCFFFFLVPVSAVLHSSAFLSEVTKRKKTEINSLSPPDSGEIRAVEMNVKYICSFLTGKICGGIKAIKVKKNELLGQLVLSR